MMAGQSNFHFKLFVAGNTPNSRLALANLSALCGKLLTGRHEIEVVDVLNDPGQALSDGIYMTPTLVKVLPLPPGRVVGTLGDAQLVADALGLIGES